MSPLLFYIHTYIYDYLSLYIPYKISKHWNRILGVLQHSQERWVIVLLADNLCTSPFNRSSCPSKRHIRHLQTDNIYYYTSYINNHKYINLIGQWVKIRTRDHTGQKSYSVKEIYSTPSEASRVFSPELLFFDRKTPEALGTHHLQATVTMWLWMWFLNV